MKTYTRRYWRWRVSETEGLKGKSPYITPLLRRNASVRRSPVGGTVGRSGETRTEGNGGEGRSRDVSWGRRVVVVETFDEGGGVDIVVRYPGGLAFVETFPFDQVLDTSVAEAAVKDLFHNVLFDTFDKDWGGWWDWAMTGNGVRRGKGQFDYGEDVVEGAEGWGELEFVCSESYRSVYDVRTQAAMSEFGGGSGSFYVTAV